MTLDDDPLFANALPPLVLFTQRLAPEDTLVVPVGFEERALATLRDAASRRDNGFRVLLIEYEPQVESNRLNEALELCALCDAQVLRLRYDRRDPAGIAEAVFEQSGRAGTLFLDVSGMSRLMIVQLVAFAVRTKQRSSVCVLYTAAQEYPPTRDEVAELTSDEAHSFGSFLSSDVLDLCAVPELSSVAMQGQPIRLIAFPTWNPTQLAALHSELQAASCTLVHGVPPSPQLAWRTDALRKLNVRTSRGHCDELEASTLDYRQTVRAIAEEYRKHAVWEKLVVSPTGSKMQAVAVGLCCGRLEDLQVVYPTPSTFVSPRNYTLGVAETYCLALSGALSPMGAASLNEAPSPATEDSRGIR